MRLFIAIGMPPEVQKILRQYQPITNSFARITHPHQFHLTLHFIGENDVDAVLAVLRDLTFEPFSINVSGTGYFKARHGKKVLWAGIDANKALNALHQDIGERLAHLGVTWEHASYRPHITLARCKGGFTQSDLDEFLAIKTAPINLAVDRITLYESVTIQGQLEYRPIKTFLAND